MKMFRHASVVAFGGAGVLLVIACSGSDSSSSSGTSATPTPDSGARGGEPAGQACTAASQCFTDVTGITGEVTCLTKVTNGYCTHTCTKDDECCAATGECRTGVKEVCSPFENQAQQYCFLSCEDADIARAIAANADAGYYDGGVTEAGSAADAYCQSYAGASTSCRSSGGGNKNRKVCVPNQ